MAGKGSWRDWLIDKIRRPGLGLLPLDTARELRPSPNCRYRYNLSSESLTRVVRGLTEGRFRLAPVTIRDHMQTSSDHGWPI